MGRPVILWFVASIAISVNGAAHENRTTLRIQWANSAAAGGDSVSLIPVDVDLPPGLTRDEAIDKWTQDIASAEQQWDGLPPGTYQIVIRAANAAAGVRAPIDAGEVVLAPNEHRTISVAVPDATAPFSDIRIILSETSNDRVTVVHWHNGTPAHLEHRSFTVHARCAAGDILQFLTAGRIGTAVLDGKCGSAIAVTMMERANVTARISVPAGAVSPPWGTISCDGVSNEIPFEVVHSRIEAAVPAACRQLSLRLSGFTPVTVPYNSDLGTIALSEGAAVAMRVRGGRDGALLSGVRVTALRSHDAAVMRDASEINRLSIVDAITNAAGWVRLASLPEERLVFVLHAPGRKYPQFSEPYAFKRGAETIIKDLRFDPPATVFVTVSLAEPLKDAIELRDVELSSTGHSHWPARAAIRGELTSSGAVIEDVPPGTWKVSMAGRLKNGHSIRTAETTVDVSPGVDAYVALDLHDTLYRGRITRDGQPVAGVVNLKPATRGNGGHTVATADADGMFTVLLEKEGDYSFSLQERGGDGVRLDHFVHFGRPEDEVVIELPEHHIRGRVVDASGTAVRDTVVSANQELGEPAGMAAARNASDGRFEISNVSSGTWNVVAQNASGRSEPAIVTVNGGDVDDVSLTLEPIRTVRVRLVDVTGTPVRDAIIAADFPVPGAPTLKSIVSSTNDNGFAELRVSANEEATPVSVIIATMDVRLTCALTRLNTDQTLQLPIGFGEVRIVGPPLQRGIMGRYLLSSSGCSVPFIGRRVEQENSGEPSFVFSNLAAGTWAYVETRTPEEQAAVITGRGALLKAIRTFTVRPGGAVRVSLPERQ